MKISAVLLQYFFIALVIPHLSQCQIIPIPPSLLDHSVIELSYGSSIDAQIQATQWTIVGQADPNLPTGMVCNGLYIIGGVGILNPGGYFQRIYSPIPPHTMIYYRLRMYIIDDWKAPDMFQIQFDSVNPLSFNPVPTKDLYATNLCGNSLYSDFDSYIVRGKSLHSGTSLTLRVISNLHQSPTTASLGIRGIRVLFANPVLLAEESCAINSNNAYGDGVCSCPSGRYYSSGACLLCSGACEFCFGPSAAECYDCAGAYVWNGAQCVTFSSANCQLYSAGACAVCNAGYYLYWDSTCQATCPAPYLAFGNGDYKVCQTPCQSSEYMYWDNTCLNSCTYPLKTVVQGSAKFCQFPCTTSTDYLYWDGTCSATCLHYPRVWTWRKFCDPCPSGLYLYPDNSCHTTCSSPYQLQLVGTASLCNPICTSGKFLLGTSTCLSSCVFNFQATMVSGQSVCSFPCADTSQYLYWNGSCISKCPYTSTTYGIYKFCTGCSPGYYLYPDGTCLPGCVAPLYASTVPGASFQKCHYPCSGSLTVFSAASYLKCPGLYSYPYSVAATHSCGLDLSPNLSIQMQAVAAVINGLALMVSALAIIVMFISPKNPTPFCLLLSFKMLEHLKYILAKYPARLQQVLNYQGFAQGILNISPTIPDRVVSAFPSHSLPTQFGTYGLYSSFFANSWNPLISLVTVAIIALVIIAFEAWVKDLKFVRWMISKIKPAMTLPNFFILFLLSTYYNDAIIFTSMEARTLHLKSFVSVFSFLIMLAINGLIVFFLVKVFIAFKEARKEVTQIHDVNGPAPLPRDEWKYKDYQIFFEACREGAYLHHIFIFAYLVKTYLYTIFIAYIFAYPFIASFFTTFTSGLILLFILLQNSFKDRMHRIQFITQEAILTIANACVLIIASLDSTCKQAFAFREALGGILLSCYFGLIVAGGIFMIKTIRDVVARKIAAGRFIKPTRDMVTAPAIAVEHKPRAIHPWASYTPNFNLEQKMGDVSPNVSQKLDVNGHSADRKNETMDLFLVTNANESRLMGRTNRSHHFAQGEESMVGRRPNKIKFDTSDIETVYKKKETLDLSLDNNINHSQRKFRGTWKSNNGPGGL